MRIEDKLDSSQPAMIVTYGNTTRKIRPMDRDVMMLGSSAGCDVQLKSPDVFPVHVLLIRLPDGWRMRDCTGRGELRLNGRCISDEPLGNGDVVQISTFSFQLHLPRRQPVHARNRAGRRSFLQSPRRRRRAAVVDPYEMKKLKKSRLRMAQLALRLRKRYGSLQAAHEQVQEQLEHAIAISKPSSAISTPCSAT